MKPAWRTAHWLHTNRDTGVVVAAAQTAAWSVLHPFIARLPTAAAVDSTRSALYRPDRVGTGQSNHWHGRYGPAEHSGTKMRAPAWAGQTAMGDRRARFLGMAGGDATPALY